MVNKSGKEPASLSRASLKNGDGRGDMAMKKYWIALKVEVLLFLRDFFGFFFTFAFPVLMLLLFGGIYGNEPSPYFGGLGAMDASVPAYTAMSVGVTGLMAFPLAIASRKESKVYKRFDATPMGKGRIIAIQALVNVCMTVAGFLLLFLAGKLVYRIRIDGSWLLIGLSLLLSICAIFSLGFLFTALAPTARISNLLCYLSYFLMLFLSGATIPQELFPEALKQFSRFLPLTHVVLLLQGTFRNASFADYSASVLVLATLTAVCLLAGALLYRRKSWA